VVQVPAQNTTLLSLEDGPKEFVDELELELEQVKCSWRFMLTIEVEMGTVRVAMRVNCRNGYCACCDACQL
jgi:hypothetical protein